MKFFLIFFVLISSVLYADNNLTLKTTAFSEAGNIPALYTCDGKDISPVFSWVNAPAKTQTFAFVVSDPDAPSGTFYHWIVYNVPASIKNFRENMTQLPAGTVTAKNSWGASEYKGPCPPNDSKHHYIFTIYALDSVLKVADDADMKFILEQIKTHALDSAQMTAVYSH